MTFSRRHLVLAGGLAGIGAVATGGLALVDRGVLPGQSALNRTLGRCDVAVPAAGPPGGTTVTGTFDSARRRGPVNYLLYHPPGTAPGDRLPVCLVLHGYGATAADAVSAGRYDRHLAAVVAGGEAPFVLAAMDGGPGYWHPHPADDPLGALLDEFLPLLGSRGLLVDRVAALGWSMGGYGALLCGISRPARFGAVVASAPAFWRSYAEAHRVNPGAFDSADQWRRYDLMARTGELRGIRVRIDCGTGDPFAPAVRALRTRLPDPAVVHLAAGCHDGAFWQHVAPTQLSLISRALAG